LKDEFTEKLVARASKLRPADPLDPKTRLGAIVSQEQMQTVLGFIEAGKKDGAKLIAGGNRVAIDGSKGFFLEPTIFGDVKNDMKIAREEIFGPVLSVLDAGCEEGPHSLPATEGRHSLDQHVRLDGRIAAIWWIQEFWLWPRTRSACDGALHGTQNSLAEYGLRLLCREK
jgi:delta 1-pyrroline-5-carboxylate dehydrogenase